MTGDQKRPTLGVPFCGCVFLGKWRSSSESTVPTVLTTGFVQSLEFLKKSWVFFFFCRFFFFNSYSTSSACLQRCAPRKKLCSYVLRSLLITCLITVSLEKEVIVWKKFWKKSWILDPKICVNPVTSSSREIFFRWFFFSTITLVPHACKDGGYRE